SVAHSASRSRYSSRSSSAVWLLTSVAISESQLARTEVLEDLFGAAADHHHLHLAVDALALRAAHEPHAAKDLHSLVGAELHRLRSEDLGHRDARDKLLRLGRAVLDAVRQLVHQRAPRVDAQCHVHQLVADHLALDERLPERLALAGPGECLLETHLRETVGLGRHEQPLSVEVVHEGLEALVLDAYQVGDWHPAIVEAQMGSVRGPPPHLL